MYPFTSNLYDNQQLISFLKTTPKTTIPKLKQLPEEAVLWRAVSVGRELKFHLMDREYLGF